MSVQGSPPQLGAPLARQLMGGGQFTSIHNPVIRDSGAGDGEVAP